MTAPVPSNEKCTDVPHFSSFGGFAVLRTPWPTSALKMVHLFALMTWETEWMATWARAAVRQRPYPVCRTAACRRCCWRACQAWMRRTTASRARTSAAIPTATAAFSVLPRRVAARTNRATSARSDPAGDRWAPWWARVLGEGGVWAGQARVWAAAASSPSSTRSTSRLSSPAVSDATAAHQARSPCGRSRRARAAAPTRPAARCHCSASAPAGSWADSAASRCAGSPVRAGPEACTRSGALGVEAAPGSSRQGSACARPTCGRPGAAGPKAHIGGRRPDAALRGAMSSSAGGGTGVSTASARKAPG